MTVLSVAKRLRTIWLRLFPLLFSDCVFVDTIVDF